MPYTGLNDFISDLENHNELQRIKVFTDPSLEISEITDRITKNNGKALLFENNGTDFPLLINAFGSDRRMAMAIGKSSLSEATEDISASIEIATDTPDGFYSRLKKIPPLLKIAGFLPSKISGRGKCQQIVHKVPDLNILPVLKCWPFDGGKFITLPLVHTVHPETGKVNAGMYRMHIFDSNSTGMHWQRHKTGANHYEAWKKTGRKMPVTVTLGGDPVYTYCATAPLPENIDEYILAGFLRKKKVRLVKCLTNELYIPEDSDIVIEGYVDPSEPLVKEGPFGDHTGFYSLADMYPVFHVTCITHAAKAVYPATIVGIPPQEDSWIAKATEMIFLAPLKIAVQPEITDLHLPDAGIAHNLVIVSITKTYPGQGVKVINALSGAGQMMFSKYIVVVSGDVNIRDYSAVAKHILDNTDFSKDIVFSHGPLDVLDHSSDTFSFGGKAGIDATVKLPEESQNRNKLPEPVSHDGLSKAEWLKSSVITKYNSALYEKGTGIFILAADTVKDPYSVKKITDLIRGEAAVNKPCLFLVLDNTVEIDDYFMVAWQVLGNTDPVRDHTLISQGILMIDATIKYLSQKSFPRSWPNVVCSQKDTIDEVDRKWNSYGFKEFIVSPSLKSIRLQRKGSAEIE